MVKDSKNLEQIGIGHAVKDVFAVSACGHHAFIAQHAQLLRQGRLADAELRLEIADAHLVLRQLAQQQHALNVGQQLQRADRLIGGPAKHLGVEGGGRLLHELTSSFDKLVINYTY